MTHPVQIHKQQRLHLLTNVWDLTDDLLDSLNVSAYYMDTISGKDLKESLHDGIIEDNQDTYSVIYRSCSPAIAFKCDYLRVSYRASPDGNFAIVQPVRT